MKKALLIAAACVLIAAGALLAVIFAKPRERPLTVSITGAAAAEYIGGEPAGNARFDLEVSYLPRGDSERIRVTGGTLRLYDVFLPEDFPYLLMAEEEGADLRALLAGGALEFGKSSKSRASVLTYNNLSIGTSFITLVDGKKALKNTVYVSADADIVGESISLFFFAPHSSNTDSAQIVFRCEFGGLFDRLTE